MDLEQKWQAAGFSAAVRAKLQDLEHYYGELAALSATDLLVLLLSSNRDEIRQSIVRHQQTYGMDAIASVVLIVDELLQEQEAR